MKEDKQIPGIQELAKVENIVWGFVGPVLPRPAPKFYSVEDFIKDFQLPSAIPPEYKFAVRLREILNDQARAEDDIFWERPKYMESDRQTGRWRVIGLSYNFGNFERVLLNVDEGPLIKFRLQPKDRLSKSERNFKRFLAKKAQSLSNK